MRIGVPTEIKCNEFRVGLVPGSVHELTACGHDVVVQSGAGAGIFADDAAYEKAGARILPTAQDVFAECYIAGDREFGTSRIPVDALSEDAPCNILRNRRFRDFFTRGRGD